MSFYHDFHCATQTELFKIVSTLKHYSFWSSIVFEWSDQHKLPSSLQVASHPLWIMHQMDHYKDMQF